MTISRVLGLFGLLGVALSSLSGCGDGDGRNAVYGTVTIGNEPIRGGFVIIEPASAANGAGRQGIAVIRNGKFDTRESGEPAVAGPVVIRVMGSGQPTERFPGGVPVCRSYEMRMELTDGPNELELKVPESARVKEPKGGWGEGP